MIKQDYPNCCALDILSHFYSESVERLEEALQLEIINSGVDQIAILNREQNHNYRKILFNSGFRCIKTFYNDNYMDSKDYPKVLTKLQGNLPNHQLFIWLRTRDDPVLEVDEQGFCSYKENKDE